MQDDGIHKTMEDPKMIRIIVVAFFVIFLTLVIVGIFVLPDYNAQMGWANGSDAEYMGGE